MSAIERLAAASRGERARLSVSVVTEDSLSLGAYQRARSCLTEDALSHRLTRRLSGGPTLRVATHSIHLGLALPRPSFVVSDADIPRFLNRHVRPLLSALKKLGVMPRYPGRDFVSTSDHALAWVGFAHHAATHATLFEAILAVETPFVLPDVLDGYACRREIPYMGKKAGALASLAAKPRDAGEAAKVIRASYEHAYGELEPLDASLLSEAVSLEEAPFSALEEAVVGFVCASSERPREVGGDFFASFDLVHALSGSLDELPTGASESAVRAAFQRVFDTVPGFVEGVRDGDAFVRVALAALAVS